MSQVIRLRQTEYHMFRGQLFVDFTEQDWGRVNKLETEYEKKTCKALHQCRRWAIDTIVNERVKGYADGLQAPVSDEEWGDIGTDD